MAFAITRVHIREKKLWLSNIENAGKMNKLFSRVLFISMCIGSLVIVIFFIIGPLLDDGLKRGTPE